MCMLGFVSVYCEAVSPMLPVAIHQVVLKLEQRRGEFVEERDNEEN